MSFRGPSIIKTNGGLGQLAPSDRNVAGLIFAKGYEVGSTFTFGNVYELNSADDIAELGLTPATDANAAADTTALCYYHLSEYFRLNPSGKLWVYNGNAVAASSIFSSAGPADALMAASANGIRHMGVVFGFDPGATLTIATGFANFVNTAQAAAQTWAEARAAAFVYVDNIMIEGVAASTTLVDLKTRDSAQVSIVVACDHGYLQDYDAEFTKTAAVGTALGSIGVRMLSESIGSLTIERPPASKRGRPNYSLVDSRQNRWLKPGLSTTQAFDDLTQAVRDELTAKAYIYAGKYEGYAGVYFNADPTLTLATDDYNTIHINRIWDEATRMVRRALIPRMNSRVQIDPATGRIKPSTIADWDAAAKRELETLLFEGEIADFRFTIDPAQDVIATGKVVVSLAITPQGIAKEIEATIGFANPAQA
jgi:hypothetical protein